MPRMSEFDIAKENCGSCEYFQWQSRWCMRPSCYKPQFEEYKRREAEKRTVAKTQKAVREASRKRNEEFRQKKREEWAKLSPEERKARIDAAVQARKTVCQKVDDKRMAIYIAGGGKLTDKQLAKLFGYKKPELACMWRKKHGLPCHYEENSAMAKHMRIDTIKMSELYLQGMTDGEIAENLDCNKATVRNWRVAHGLKYNVSPENKRGAAITKDEHKRRMEVYRLGLSDSKSAKQLGISENTYWKWRKKHGLKASGFLNQSGKRRPDANAD